MAEEKKEEVRKPRGYQAGLTVCLVIIVVLAFALNSLNADKTNLQNQVNSLQSQINTYSAWLSGNITLLEKYKTWAHENNTLYEKYGTWLNGNITYYENQIASLKAPKLILVNLKSDDHDIPVLPLSYLHVYGEVCNVGNDTAYDCKLHVVLYQSGGVIAKDTYIELGTINGESWTTVDSNVYCENSALINWTITPEWRS